ncbi:EamA family transporter [Flavobacteriaceae bacterium Ap0902]|nr:EamA family transporter [Flavobacteriaceae bacterium Ap0902]
MIKTQLRLHFLVLLWGFTGVIGKLISISAIPLVFWRTFLSSIGIFIFLKLLGVSIEISKKQLIRYLGVGVVMGLHWILFFGAIKVSNVSVALSTLSTGALFAAFLEPIFYKRKINPAEVILAVIVIICLWFIFKASPEYMLGIIMGIICASLSALMTVLNGVIQQDKSNKPRIMILFEMIGACLVAAIVMPFFNDIPTDIALNYSDFWWLIILALCLTAYPVIESVVLMKYISPYSLILAINLEPVYGIIIAYLIFGDSEVMSPTFYIAGFIMLLVVVLNGIYQSKLDKKKQLRENPIL